MKSSISLFLFLMLLAMWIYPGGTVMDPKAAHFLFWQNFLSDLGRSRTFAGESNLSARLFFVPGIVFVAGVIGVFFHRLLPRLILQTRPGFRKSFRWALGITVVARVCVALTPWDVIGYLHLFFVQLTFFSGLMLGVLLIRESRQPGSILTGERLPLRIWVIFQGTYLLLLTFAPFLHITSDAMLYVAAGSQKILLLMECVVYVRLGGIKAPVVPGPDR